MSIFMSQDAPISDVEIKYLSNRLYLEVRDRLSEHYLKWAKRVVLIVSVILPFAGNYVAFTFVERMVQNRIDARLEESIVQQTLDAGRTAFATAAAQAEKSIEATTLSRTDYQVALEQLGTAMLKVDSIAAQVENARTEFDRVVSNVNALYADLNRRAMQIEGSAVQIEGVASEIEAAQSYIREAELRANELNETLLTNVFLMQSSIDELSEYQEQGRIYLDRLIDASSIAGSARESLIQSAIDAEKSVEAVLRIEEELETTVDDIVRRQLRGGSSFDQVVHLLPNIIVIMHLRQGRSFDHVRHLLIGG